MADKSLSGLRRVVSKIGRNPIRIGVDAHEVNHQAALVTTSVRSRTRSCPGQGRLEKATAGIYANISRIGFSDLTMRSGRRAFSDRP